MPSSRLLAARPPRGVASSSNPSAQPNNGVVKQRRYHHTALDWGSKKQTIIQLYITENRRVEDVIKILKSEFAFNTSLRRFKQEIGKWGVRKNKERDAGGVRHAQEKAGEENSAVGLDDTVPETASLSSDLLIRNRSPPYSPYTGSIFNEINARDLSALHLLTSPSQPRQPLHSCVGASPASQLRQLQEIPLEEINLKTPRLPSDDSNDPPLLLTHAYSPQCTELAGPSTAIAIRRRSPTPSPAIMESRQRPPSENRDIFPASHQALQETTASMCRESDPRTSQISSSLENGIRSVVEFATSNEGIINHADTLQLKEDLRLLLDSAQSGVLRTCCTGRKFCDDLYLMKSLVSSASNLAINTHSSSQFPSRLLLETWIVLRRRHTRARVGTSILDITVSKMNLMRVHYIYTSVTIIFRPNASTFTLRIEANQLEPFHGSFSSIPRLFINNIIPSHAKVFQVAAEGSIQDLENLFASGQANIRDHGENGWSLLHHSLRNPPMCRFLIRSGLDVDEICCDVRRNSCLTPLHISYYHFGNIETTRSLLMGGADPVIEPGANISVAYDAIFGPEPESSTLFWDIIDLSSHFLFFNPTDSDRATLWLSAFQPRQYMMPHLGCLPSPAKKIEFLLNKGARPDKRIQWDQTV